MGAQPPALAVLTERRRRHAAFLWAGVLRPEPYRDGDRAAVVVPTPVMPVSACRLVAKLAIAIASPAEDAGGGGQLCGHRRNASLAAGYPWPWSNKRQPPGFLTKHRLHGCQPVGMVPSGWPCVYISNSTHSSLRPASDAGTWLGFRTDR